MIQIYQVMLSKKVIIFIYLTQIECISISHLLPLMNLLTHYFIRNLTAISHYLLQVITGLIQNMSEIILFLLQDLIPIVLIFGMIMSGTGAARQLMTYLLAHKQTQLFLIQHQLRHHQQHRPKAV